MVFDVTPSAPRTSRICGLMILQAGPRRAQAAHADGLPELHHVTMR
jgi:hypothetical protein